MPCGGAGYQAGLFGGDVLVELQLVGEGTAPRVHVDIDIDDVDAEVQRLEALGARRLQSTTAGVTGRWSTLAAWCSA